MNVIEINGEKFEYSCNLRKNGLVIESKINLIFSKQQSDIIREQAMKHLKRNDISDFFRCIIQLVEPQYYATIKVEIKSLVNGELLLTGIISEESLEYVLKRIFQEAK